MRLDGPNGSLELTIVGYQFPSAVPEVEGFDHDANWLVVAGEVTHGDRSWRFREPCLLTAEADELASWLERMAEGRSLVDALDFAEPSLAFRRASLPDRDHGVRVVFELEARPPWHRFTGDEGDSGTVWLDIATTQDALRSAARSLREDLLLFPVRSHEGKASGC